MKVLKCLAGMSVGVVFLGLVAVGNAGAATRSFFPPDGSRAMIFIQETFAGGNIDGDSTRLYEAIAGEPSAVPGGGQGKMVKTPEGTLNLSCVKKQAEGPVPPVCSLLVKAGPGAQLELRAPRVEFVVTGPGAAAIFERFTPSEPGIFRYDTVDGLLLIEAREAEFRLTYGKK